MKKDMGALEGYGRIWEPTCGGKVVVDMNVRVSCYMYGSEASSAQLISNVERLIKGKCSLTSSNHHKESYLSII